MSTYKVYQVTDNGYDIIATVKDGDVSGIEAESIEKLLRSRGWPDKNPLLILNGSYCWAAEVSDKILANE